MSDDRKLTLSDKPAAPASKPGETGKLRLGLGARRSKPVVVERKRRRILRKDGETPVPKPVVEENLSLKPKRPTTEPAEEAESTADVPKESQGFIRFTGGLCWFSDLGSRSNR